MHQMLKLMIEAHPNQYNISAMLVYLAGSRSSPLVAWRSATSPVRLMLGKQQTHWFRLSSSSTPRRRRSTRTRSIRTCLCSTSSGLQCSKALHSDTIRVLNCISMF